MKYEVLKYTDDDGKSVTAYVPIPPDGEHRIPQTNPKYHPRYEGTVGIGTPIGVQPINFPFPQKYTLDECFDKFEEVAQVEVQKIMEEAQKKQQEENLIVTPDQMKGNNPSIIPFPGT